MGEALLSEEEFLEAAEEALERLPDPIRARLENVEVGLEDEPSPEALALARVPPGSTLLGLYLGLPLRQREPFFMLPRLPDRIVLFRGPLERLARTREALLREIRRTVAHEVGHHLGLSEVELRRLETSVSRFGRP